MLNTKQVRVRPTSVTVAVALLGLTAVGYLLDAAALVAGAGAYPERVREAVEASDVDPAALSNFVSFVRVAPYVAAAITALAAVCLVAIAASVRAGHNAGRIVAWVAIGLTLLCNMCGAGNAGTPAFSGIVYIKAFSSDSSGRHMFVQRLPDAYPPAYRYSSGAFALMAMVALIVVAVLLALGPANRFFRPVRPSAHPLPGYPMAYPPQWRPTVPPPSQYPVASPPPGYPAYEPAAQAADPGPESLTDQQRKRLAELVRQYQRGELTTEAFESARQRLLN